MDIQISSGFGFGAASMVMGTFMVGMPLNERNARTFNHVSIMPTVIFDKIKMEVRT
jgi:hypothetical protein